MKGGEIKKNLSWANVEKCYSGNICEYNFKKSNFFMKGGENKKNQSWANVEKCYSGI